MTAGKQFDALAMACPSCGQAPVPPLSGSTLTIAWYACLCGHFWSARVRDGRPVEGGTQEHRKAGRQDGRLQNPLTPS